MKKQSCHLFLLPALLLGILFSSCEKYETCLDEDVTVTVYEHINFEGVSQTFGIGLHFIAGQFLNDKISSIQLSSPNCMKVTLYEHANPNDLGIFEEYTSDQIFIDNLNDRVSAIKVEKQ